eukprot:jgi/Bigna1/134200/aug1.24_g8908
MAGVTIDNYDQDDEIMPGDTKLWISNAQRVSASLQKCEVMFRLTCHLATSQQTSHDEKIKSLLPAMKEAK